jgi:LytS/YehU family sensor histidine kinase
MNPHFIFNSLNSIQKYISENDERNAQKYLNRFARLIRLILESSRSDSFLLEDEITLLGHYLALESNRFKDKFSFEIVVDSHLNEDFTRIPPMIIQPFVENAIIHGMNGKQETGQIKIQFHKNESGSLLCVVDDDGVGRKIASGQPNKAKQHKPVGVLIAKERLGHLNHGADQGSDVIIIDKYNDQGESIGTRVEINLPILAS